MLVIRNNQMKVLEEFAAQNFGNELVQHIKSFTPRHSQVIGETGVRHLVQSGIKRAESHGFTNRGPVRFYVELMVMFGSDFDTDSQFPWAQAVLKTESISDQMERADVLHSKMLDYLSQVSGPDHNYLINALQRLNQARIEDYQALRDNFENQIVAGLRALYPQKCEYLGEPPLRTLVQRGKEIADAYSVTTERGIVLFIALTFTLGHGFAADPLYPWISATLEDKSTTDPNQRAEQVYKKMKTYLEQSLKYLEQR